MNDAEMMAEAIEKVVDDKIAKALRDGTQTVAAEYMGTDADGKMWVMLPGAASATPVRRSSVETSVGDTVNVTVGDGMAVIDANLTDKSAGVAGVAKVDEKATVAQETAVEAIDYASQASAAANSAQSSADSALQFAGTARIAADSAVADAARANDAAEQAISDASDAADAADSAQESANRATYALADMEKVVGTVNWIAEHGEYLPTEDTAVDASKVYYTRSGSGTQADPYTYSVVSNPVDSELSTYFELHVDESIQNFINMHVWLTQDGLYVGTQGADYKTRVDSDSLDILDEDGEVVATFGEATQIGRDGESRLELDYHSLQLVDMDGDVYFRVNDLRNSDGEVELSESFTGDGYSTIYTLAYLATQITSCTVDGASASYTTSTGAGVTRVLLDTAPPSGSTVVIEYTTDSDTTKSYTLGARMSGTSDGPMSFAEGNDVEASGYASHAEGDRTRATGRASHAEGVSTEASGNWGHAEGVSSAAVGSGSHAEGESTTASSQASHAEGYQTVADGNSSHAEGNASKANGYASHAQNEGTIASSSNQTALGSYNIEDVNDTYSVIIGNGASAAARSNALTVDWSGNVACGKVNGVDVTAIGSTATPVSATTSVADGANANVASISLAAGTWMVCAKVQFPNNATGRRAVKLSTTSQDSGSPVSMDVQLAVSGAAMHMSTSRCFKLASAGTVYLVAWQNSGGALSCTGNIEATRIR